MAKRTTRKAVPTFASERAEREYWETHDAAGVVDWSAARAGGVSESQGID